MCAQEDVRTAFKTYIKQSYLPKFLVALEQLADHPNKGADILIGLDRIVEALAPENILARPDNPLDAEPTTFKGNYQGPYATVGAIIKDYIIQCKDAGENMSQQYLGQECLRVSNKTIGAIAKAEETGKEKCGISEGYLKKNGEKIKNRLSHLFNIPRGKLKEFMDTPFFIDNSSQPQ